jgi:indole-3-glycerol phosphate synthase
MRMSRLDEIVALRRKDIEPEMRRQPLEQMRRLAADAPAPQDFPAALRNGRQPGAPALIAEIKRASPSRGDLAPDLDPAALAARYCANGAAAISVLTETRHFKGSLQDLRAVKAAGLGIPVLRKDFIIEDWQVYEARQAGADAVLLIATCLEPARLSALHKLAESLGMAALVEIHDRRELDVALACRPSLIGINNRNLASFEVSLETVERLRPLVPMGITVVAESGIHNRADVDRVQAAGVDAILVGEALVTAGDVDARVRLLAGMEPA